ncbi:ead/Ea22-like family protein [Raoultella ornithinolytica]|uniref:ead/Ea22-like family protein n=1 Tax=Raoultella ornithinolytica TaxID=54291 RepID=UPI001F45258C|nr:ead/Ea22-like family protein [Raoultella ornithinolytica]
MTTDITELAQREKFEAWAEECNALPWGYLKKLRIYTGFYSDHTYTSLWAAWKAAGAELVEALEKAQQYAKERDAENQDLMLTVGRLRVEREELESRTVKLPKKNIGWDRDEDDCWNNAIDACTEALTAAGIKWELSR